jgi:hypothetical protein
MEKEMLELLDEFFVDLESLPCSSLRPLISQASMLN